MKIIQMITSDDTVYGLDDTGALWWFNFSSVANVRIETVAAPPPGMGGSIVELTEGWVPVRGGNRTAMARLAQVADKTPSTQHAGYSQERMREATVDERQTFADIMRERMK